MPVLPGSPAAASLDLGWLDLTPLAIYFLLVFWIGGRGAGTSRSADDFMLGGRSLTLPLFVGTLVATWYGGLLGIGEIAYNDGIVTWLTQGGFWYAAYLIFALLLAGRVSVDGQTTLPDQIGLMHGGSARLFASLLNFFNVVPIAYMLSLGLLLRLATGWPIWLGILVGTSAAVLYSSLGGFRAVVRTDLLQFALMCSSVGGLMIWCVATLGGGDYLAARLPAGHLRPAGTLSTQELLVWAVIALSTLVDPNFYQRCSAARSPRVARNGILCAVGFWLLFDVCSTFTGLYARAALPGIDPRLAYPLLANAVLPPLVKGVFFTGLVATVMSTVDSYCFVGAMSIGHDLYRRTLRPGADDAQVVRATRVGVVVTALLAMGLATVFDGSIKAIWKTLGSLSSAAMLVPMLFGLAGWRPPGAGLLSMIGGTVGTLGWAAIRRWGGPRALGVEALMPGLALSLLGYLGAALVARAGGARR